MRTLFYCTTSYKPETVLEKASPLRGELINKDELNKIEGNRVQSGSWRMYQFKNCKQ